MKRALSSRIQAFFDQYLKGTGSAPQTGSATAYTQTCPGNAASGGPFSANSWSELHPGEVDYSSKPSQTISSAGGDPNVARTFDPVASGGVQAVPGTGLACATTTTTNEGSGVATYRLPAAKGPGYTLLGSATVTANFNVTGQFPEVAARLLDVNTATNTATLVARGIYRIDSNKPNGQQTFQLHPGAWHFAAGHLAELELLGKDSPYARASNGSFMISVDSLDLRLPVHETPGSVPGVVAPKPPPGCGSSYPTSRINKRRTHGSRRRVIVRGSAREPTCVFATAAIQRREKVARVRVAIYRKVGHGRCRFLTSHGKLSKARKCSRPLWLRARGTTHWKLRLRVRLPAGRYFVRSDAVDVARQQQRRDATSRIRVR